MPTPEIVPNWNIGVYYVKLDGVTLGGFHEKQWAKVFLDAVIEKQRIEPKTPPKIKQKMVSLKDIFTGNV